MYTLVGILTVIAIVFASWRFASQRQSLPCPVWLRWLVELDNPFTRTNRAAVIIEHLDLCPGMFVLDMGCGPGRIAVPAARKVGERGKVVAVDIQPGMLRRARAKADAAGIGNIEFVQAGAGDGALGKLKFERALLVTVLGEIPEREPALKEIYEALKPGGILSVTEIIFDPHFQRRSVLTRLARRAGFREKAIFGNAIAYTAHFEKPAAGRGSDRVAPEISGSPDGV